MNLIIIFYYICFIQFHSLFNCFHQFSIKNYKTFQLNNLISHKNHQKYKENNILYSSKSNIGKLIIGVNKYSHDTSIAIINSENGKVLFHQAKERITNKKHDGGSINSLIQYSLDSIHASIDDIQLIVSNNHHFRVLPFEKRIPFSNAINYIPNEYSHELNLLSNIKHIELSHHLAHAYAGIATSSYSNGLVVVMDGMGESYKAMIEDTLGIERHSGDYMHDLKLLKQQSNDIKSKFIGQPYTLSPYSGYREAESAYYFDKLSSSIIPIFKRWSREGSPPELYNHGFENHESLGAVYSRISSYVLGDWNACGKIMGLAPWANQMKDKAKSWYFHSSSSSFNDLELGEHFYHTKEFMSGNILESNSFHINWEELENLPDPNKFSSKRFGYLANIANSIQVNLQDTTIPFLSSLRQQVESSNLVFTGGVALNSVLNSHIVSSGLYENVHIPPNPGDEGIALGCAIYGYEHWKQHQDQQQGDKEQKRFYQFEDKDMIFSPYQGREFSNEEIQEVLLDYSPWLSFQKISTNELLSLASEELTQGKVLAWFQGRSEVGQRALGSRSILADPRNETLRQHINQVVKQREWFRPLAPSVLDEYTHEWFEDIPSKSNISPYMSRTAFIREDKRHLIPAVVHVDGSARLQTVDESSISSSISLHLYNQLIRLFHQKTKIPMILNTSFNRKGQPIVETPLQAIQTYLAAKGSINSLFIGDFYVTRRSFPQLTSKEEMENIFIHANPIYLYETITSISKMDEPMRIRIQDGNVDVNEEDAWITLPSSRHLEILQLLQTSIISTNNELDEKTSEYESPEHDYDGTITVFELFEALISMNVNENHENELTIDMFIKTLQDLYCMTLISFDHFDSDANDDIDPLQFFQGSDVSILDFRE